MLIERFAVDVAARLTVEQILFIKICYSTVACSALQGYLLLLRLCRRVLLRVPYDYLNKGECNWHVCVCVCYHIFVILRLTTRFLLVCFSTFEAQVDASRTRE